MKSIALYDCDPTVKTMRLFIVNSSQALSEGLMTHLHELPGLEIVGESHDLSDAVPAIRALAPDVVMLEVSHLGDKGRELVNSVTSEENSPFVMVLSGDEPGFESGPDILLYKATSVRNAVAILRNLLQHFLTTGGGFNDESGPTVH